MPGQWFFFDKNLMKKIIFAATLLISSVPCWSQTPADSIDLVKRLTEFMDYNRALDIPKVIDYSYPKLFEIVPRETIIESMQQTFDNDEMKIGMDSLAVNKIHPLFALNAGLYARVEYSMVMRIKFKQAEEQEEEKVASMLQSFRSMYGSENVWYDKKEKRLNIFQKTSMAALKDEPKEKWTFVNIKKDDPLMTRLLDKTLIEKLESYK